MRLLDKLRTLNTFMQDTSAQPVDFDAISAVLSEIIDCNTYVVSIKGKILGGSFWEFECGILASELSEEGEVRFSQQQKQELLEFTEPTRITPEIEDECMFLPDEDCPLEGKHIAILPAYGGKNRMSTLILARVDETFREEDLVLGEYGATVVALEIIRSEREKREAELEKRIEARVALKTLSVSELAMIDRIFEAFDEDDEQIMVMSEIADRANVSRSVAVGALDRLESAGVLASQSLGMKGTRVKLFNAMFRDELARQDTMKEF